MEGIGIRHVCAQSNPRSSSASCAFPPPRSPFLPEAHSPPRKLSAGALPTSAASPAPSSERCPAPRSARLQPRAASARLRGPGTRRLRCPRRPSAPGKADTARPWPSPWCPSGLNGWRQNPTAAGVRFRWRAASAKPRGQGSRGGHPCALIWTVSTLEQACVLHILHSAKPKVCTQTAISPGAGEVPPAGRASLFIPVDFALGSCPTLPAGWTWP